MRVITILFILKASLLMINCLVGNNTRRLQENRRMASYHGNDRKILDYDENQSKSDGGSTENSYETYTYTEEENKVDSRIDASYSKSIYNASIQDNDYSQDVSKSVRYSNKSNNDSFTQKNGNYRSKGNYNRKLKEKVESSEEKFEPDYSQADSYDGESYEEPREKTQKETRLKKQESTEYISYSSNDYEKESTSSDDGKEYVYESDDNSVIKATFEDSYFLSDKDNYVKPTNLESTKCIYDITRPDESEIDSSEEERRKQRIKINITTPIQRVRNILQKQESKLNYKIYNTIPLTSSNQGNIILSEKNRNQAHRTKTTRAMIKHGDNQIQTREKDIRQRKYRFKKHISKSHTRRPYDNKIHTHDNIHRKYTHDLNSRIRKSLETEVYSTPEEIHQQKHKHTNSDSNYIYHSEICSSEEKRIRHTDKHRAKRWKQKYFQREKYSSSQKIGPRKHKYVMKNPVTMSFKIDIYPSVQQERPRKHNHLSRTYITSNYKNEMEHKRPRKHKHVPKTRTGSSYESEIQKSSNEEKLVRHKSTTTISIRRATHRRRTDRRRRLRRRRRKLRNNKRKKIYKNSTVGKDDNYLEHSAHENDSRQFTVPTQESLTSSKVSTTTTKPNMEDILAKFFKKEYLREEKKKNKTKGIRKNVKRRKMLGKKNKRRKKASCGKNGTCRNNKFRRNGAGRKVNYKELAKTGFGLMDWLL